MINALVISKDIHLVQKLLNETNLSDLNIRIDKITTTRTQTLSILKSYRPDIIFLDTYIKNHFEDLFFDAYKSIIVELSSRRNLILLNNDILDRIHSIIEFTDFELKKNKVVKELEYIGYKFKYKGTHYLVDTIMQIYKSQNNMVDNLQTGIYPVIAKKYHKTIFNIKSSITKATESMYYECDSKKLESYFKFANDVKPTVKQVIFTVINKI